MAAKLDYRNDEKQDERLDPYSDSARDLYHQEQEAADQDFDSIAQNETDRDFNDILKNYDNDESKTKNIDKTKEQEQDAGWKTDVSNGGGEGNKKQASSFWQQAKKKGPMGAIIMLFGGGGLLGGALLSPAGALIHLKEVLVNKFDTMSSVVEERSILIMSKRMFGTNATCKIKVRCRFSGLTERQMARLRIQGADILDKDGKPIKKSLGRYRGGKTLVLPDGTKVDAKAYRSTMRSNPALRDLGRTVFAPRYLSWNDKISKDIRAKKKLVTNPEWGDGDEKEARKNVYKAVSGEAYTAESQDNQGTTKDKDGKDVKESGQNIDYGDDADAINKEADKLKAAAAAGELIDPIPSDPAGAAVMPDVEPSGSPVKKALGFLNPADFLVGLCTTYQITSALVLTAKVIALANAMRYASQFLSTADKIKAGEATSTDAEQAMTILQRTDKYGDNFGDAVGYQYPEYGTVPDKPVASSAMGNGVVLVLSAAIRWVNNTLGKGTVTTGCRVLTNPVVQGALALTSFIPGGGQIAKAVTGALTKTAKVVAEKAIKEAVTKMVKAAAEKVSKDALKKAAKDATKAFVKMAASAGGMFLAGYLLQKYAIPYIARELAGAMLTGSEDGVTSMDTMANGFDATNQATAQERGLMPLSKEEASVFNDFNNSSTATYVADMRAQSNPFDITDPYSASNALASTFYTFSSKITHSSLLSLPGAIFSSLNVSNLLSANTSAKIDTNYCEDEFLNSHNLAASPFCNVVMGFNDVEMLENADPDTDVTQWMLDHKEIDDDGNPKGNYATFLSTCITDSGNKQITDLGDKETQLDETCFDTLKNQTTERKMFYLYYIDSGTVDAMDAPDDPQAAATTGVKYISAGNIPETGLVVGATIFGGKISGGKWVENLADNGGNDNGNGGASSCNPNDPHLTGTSSFAELDMGQALGNIPDCTRLEIKNNATGKTIIAAKMDIGKGGGDIQGHKRAVDLWWQAANVLGLYDSGVVTIHAVDPGTELSPVSSTGNTSSNIGFSLGNLLSLTSLFSSPVRGAAL